MMNSSIMEALRKAQAAFAGMRSGWDVKDYPVLYTTIQEDADVLITGDKDFSAVDVDRPKLLTPAQFTDRYMGSVSYLTGKIVCLPRTFATGGTRTHALCKKFYF